MSAMSELPRIAPLDLARECRSFPGPVLIDVRRAPIYAAAPDALPGAIRRDPASAAQWAAEFAGERAVVVYCVHGHEVSQGAASALRAAGVCARYLDGGVEGWREAGLPMADKPAKPTIWVTRERPKIDRLACPWLIRRFVDPDARFLYVAPGEVESVAAREGGTPYDIPGVRFSHVGERCSFDAFVAAYKLAAPGLARLADVVRGADTSRLDLTPASAGLFAISLGLGKIFDDDQALLRYALTMYDALYVWCRDLQTETHAWPPAMPARA